MEDGWLKLIGFVWVLMMLAVLIVAVHFIVKHW